MDNVAQTLRDSTPASAVRCGVCEDATAVCFTVYVSVAFCDIAYSPYGVKCAVFAFVLHACIDVIHDRVFTGTIRLHSCNLGLPSAFNASVQGQEKN